MGARETVTGEEAAEYLGISFGRFKVCIWRESGLCPHMSPTGTGALPLDGSVGWSARTALYLAADIRRMHRAYNFRAKRKPNHMWLNAGPASKVIPKRLRPKRKEERKKGRAKPRVVDLRPKAKAPSVSARAAKRTAEKALRGKKVKASAAKRKPIIINVNGKLVEYVFV
jgi:hypothetical protein